MYSDFVELLSALNADGVRYLIVGGWAVSLHAQPRTTKDLDILIDPDPANAAVLYRALARFGAPLEGLTPADFAAPGSFFRMGHPPVMVDILPEIDGIDFADAWARRVEAPVSADEAVIACFIARDDLITAKLASARPQDLADVAALRKARDG
jgi:hypothetical protein